MQPTVSFRVGSIAATDMRRRSYARCKSTLQIKDGRADVANKADTKEVDDSKAAGGGGGGSARESEEKAIVDKEAANRQLILEADRRQLGRDDQPLDQRQRTQARLRMWLILSLGPTGNKAESCRGAVAQAAGRARGSWVAG